MSLAYSIDIVIPCHNVGHIVDKCINSVLNQNYAGEVNIHLVEDGSTDNTKEVLDRFSHHSNVKIIYHILNQGLAAARNSGVKAGCGEVILFLDSDMTVKPDWINRLTAPLSDENIVGIVGDQKLPNQLIENPLDRYLYSKFRGARQFGQFENIHFRYFLFSNTCLRRSVLNEVGLFDEKFITYGGEDTDLALRIWEKYPHAFRFTLFAESYHWGQKEADEFYKNMELYGQNNFKYLIDKHPAHIKALGGEFIYSLKGKVIFNSLMRTIIKGVNILFENFLCQRYLVVDSVMRGVRNGQKD